MSSRFPALLLAAALGWLAWPADRAAADVSPVGDPVRPGQSFVGDVPAGETIRIPVELARGSKLRLRFTLTVPGVEQYLPANFQRVSVTGPDGKPVPFDTARDSFARYDPRRRTSTFQTDDWPAPEGGVFTFSIVHRTKVQTRCVGRVKVVRPRKVVFTGDLAASAQERTLTLPLQPGDATKVSVRRLSGGAPFLEAYTGPGSVAYTPFQRQTKKGAKTTQLLYPAVFGDGLYLFGPQAEQPAEGRFKATVTLRPGGPYAPLQLVQRNAPGVPLSVRELDASVDIPWTGGGPLGVDFDGQYVFVTGEESGRVLGKYYGADLVDPSPIAYPTVLVTSADFSGTTQVSGHRLAFLNGHHYVAASNTAGTSAVLGRFPFNLNRSGFATVVDQSATPVNDLFLATDGLTMWVGVPTATGHDVKGYDPATVASAGAAIAIGGGGQPHVSRGSAVFRFDQNVFEFWAPTAVSSSPLVASDLSHGLYSTTWTPTVWEAARIADPVTETMATTVVLDPETGATILHYVEPTLDGTGFGVLHRRVFDALGVQVSADQTPLGTSARVRRPAATLAGDHVYLAVEGPVSALVVRFRLLRD